MDNCSKHMAGRFEKHPKGFIKSCKCGGTYECPKCHSVWGYHKINCKNYGERFDINKWITYKIVPVYLNE